MLKRLVKHRLNDADVIRHLISTANNAISSRNRIFALESLRKSDVGLERVRSTYEKAMKLHLTPLFQVHIYQRFFVWRQR